MAEDRRDTGIRLAEGEVNTDFMVEEIRQRPVNRKRLIRRTVTTSFLAVLFGAIACAVFLLLEPVLNSWLYPAETPNPVVFPTETQEGELSPEEMIAAEKDLQKAEAEEAVNQAVSQLDISKLNTSQIEDSIREDLFHKLQRQISEEIAVQMEAQEAQGSVPEVSEEPPDNAMRQVLHSVVTVTGIKSGVDWTGEIFENSGRTSGLIVADTGEALLILVNGKHLKGAETIRITFSDGAVCEGALQAQDQITSMAIVRVDRELIPEETRLTEIPATLGSSAREELLGRQVLAVGSPMGTQGSVSYGIITNAEVQLDISDSSYTLITTNIYGSTQASGILADTAGNVIGWIDMGYNKIDTANLISAIGISEIKTLIEHMSNRVQMTRLGIHGADVPAQVHEEQGVPIGTYVRRVEMDSPAMNAGVQSGDIISSFDGKPVSGCEELMEFFEGAEPDRNYPMTILRQGMDGYTEAVIEVSGLPRLTFPEGE